MSCCPKEINCNVSGLNIRNRVLNAFKLVSKVLCDVTFEGSFEVNLTIRNNMHSICLKGRSSVCDGDSNSRTT